MQTTIFAFDESETAGWDDLLARSGSNLFLHSRRFLTYHRGRFKDVSLLVRSEGELIGVFPAAVEEDAANVVVSHPGATYGGLVVSPEVNAPGYLEALSSICGRYASEGFARLRYKVVPFFYWSSPCSMDSYALFRLGAQLVRRDLSATIDLLNRGPVRERRQRDIRARMRQGLEIKKGNHFLPEVWSIVVENRMQRFGVVPTHDANEIARVAELFPQQVETMAAVWDGEAVACTVVFRSTTTDHLQYMANSDKGRESHALDALIEQAVQNALVRGARYFDFGISTEANGTVLNAGLHSYKTSFGAGTTVYDHYEIDLTL